MCLPIRSSGVKFQALKNKKVLRHEKKSIAILSKQEFADIFGSDEDFRSVMTTSTPSCSTSTKSYGRQDSIISMKSSSITLSLPQSKSTFSENHSFLALDLEFAFPAVCTSTQSPSGSDTVSSLSTLDTIRLPQSQSMLSNEESVACHLTPQDTKITLGSDTTSSQSDHSSCSYRFQLPKVLAQLRIDLQANLAEELTLETACGSPAHTTRSPFFETMDLESEGVFVATVQKSIGSTSDNGSSVGARTRITYSSSFETMSSGTTSDNVSGTTGSAKSAMTQSNGLSQDIEMLVGLAMSEKDSIFDSREKPMHGSSTSCDKSNCSTMGVQTNETVILHSAFGTMDLISNSDSDTPVPAMPELQKRQSESESISWSVYSSECTDLMTDDEEESSFNF